MDTDLTLLYGNKAVGVVKEPFLSDGTWYGTVHIETVGTKDEADRRLIEYIRFVEDWNERVRSGGDASADEFDSYSDLTASGMWATKDANGEITPIIEAPVFFRGDEISWRTS
jgi:hypothetical protein